MRSTSDSGFSSAAVWMRSSPWTRPIRALSRSRSRLSPAAPTRAGSSTSSWTTTRQHATALAHLSGLGHRNLAVIKGPSSRSDAEVRWRALQRAARAMCTPIDPGLAVHVRGVDDSPELGYRATRTLLATGARFTALLAFSDLVAVGAIQALGESGRRVSRDVSVVGYGDMQEAAFQTPALTTVRQPLAEMGRIAAEWIIRRITAPAHAPYPRTVVVEPEFVVRDSTGSAPT